MDRHEPLERALDVSLITGRLTPEAAAEILILEQRINAVEEQLRQRAIVAQDNARRTTRPRRSR